MRGRHRGNGSQIAQAVGDQPIVDLRLKECIIKTPMRPIQYELRCPECKLGRAAFTGKGRQTNPPAFLHLCDKCQAQIWITGATFPQIKFEAK